MRVRMFALLEVRLGHLDQTLERAGLPAVAIEDPGIGAFGPEEIPVAAEILGQCEHDVARKSEGVPVILMDGEDLGGQPQRASVEAQGQGPPGYFQGFLDVPVLGQAQAEAMEDERMG